MENDTLFNEDDEKKNNMMDDEENIDDVLDLEDEDDDIIPIEETGGSGRKILWTIVVLIIIGLGIYSFAKREQIRETLQSENEQEAAMEQVAAGEESENFTWNNEEQPSVEQGEEGTLNNSKLPDLEEFTEEEDQNTEEATEDKTNEEVAQAENTDEPSTTEQTTIETSNAGITVSAAAGDGVTHLARKALAKYLEDSGDEVNNEQKIYIEDYLKDKTGTAGLSVGETKTFSDELLDEAIAASKKLDDAQLKNLEKYSKVVFGITGN